MAENCCPAKSGYCFEGQVCVTVLEVAHHNVVGIFEGVMGVADQEYKSDVKVHLLDSNVLPKPFATGLILRS